MNLENLIIYLLIIELAIVLILVINIFVLNYINRTRKMRLKIRTEKVDSIIKNALENKIDLDTTIEKLIGIVSSKELLKVIEKYNQTFKSKAWEDIKKKVFDSYLIHEARKKASSRSWKERLFSARCFSISSTKSDASMLLKLMNDRNNQVRFRIGPSIIRHEIKEGVIQMVKYLSLKPQGSYARAIYLDQLTNGSSKVFEWIEELADEERDNQVHLACLEILKSKEFVISRPFLKENLNSSNPEIRLATVTIYAHNLQHDSEATLLENLNDPDELIKEQAIYGLGYFNRKTNIDKLVLLLDDASWRIRVQAAYSLIRMGEPGIAALNNVDRTVKKTAYETAQYALTFNE